MSGRPAKALAGLVGAIAIALLAAGPAGAAFLTPEYESTLTGAGDHLIGEALAVAVDEETHDIYVADKGNNRVEKFDADGNFLFKFGNFGNPSSIAVDNSDGPSQGDVYVAEGLGENEDPVFKFDSAGQPVASFGTAGALRVKKIRRMTVSPFDGSVWIMDGVSQKRPDGNDQGYITSYTEAGVQKFSVEQWGDAGNVGTLAVDADDRVWFSDHNETPLVLDISRYGETEFHAIGRFDPGTSNNFTVNPVNGDVLAVINGSEVTVFRGSCDPSLGFCVPRESFGGGQLTEPKGLAIDGSTGSVYVAVNGGVAVFRSLVVPDVTPKPASVGHTDVVLSAHLDPLTAGQITGCQVEYGETTAYGSTAACDQAPPLSGPSDVTGHLAGMATETRYHYRFNATNGNGTSHGPDLTFTPHWVTGLETGDATDIEPGAATLHGELDPDGDATRYYFEWGTSKSYGHRTPDLPGTETSAADLTQVETSLSGLLTSITTYHYRLVAVNSLGTSYGSDRQFTTPLGGAPQLAGVSGVATGTNGALLRAEVNPNFGETAYRFQYGSDASYGRGTVIGPPIANDGTFHPVSAGLTGLAPETTYHFRIVAFNFADRVVSPDMTFTTLATPAGDTVARAVPTAILPVVKRPIQKPGCRKGTVRRKGKCIKKRHRHPGRGKGER